VASELNVERRYTEGIEVEWSPASTWIAHGSGSADKAMVDEHDCVAVPPNDPAYTLRRVWLSEEEQDGYYYGLANEGLWPSKRIGRSARLGWSRAATAPKPRPAP
jgi:trehalose-6-phosphate synthase